MLVKYNTDNTTDSNESDREYYIAAIERELERFSKYISRVELHVSDQNGPKEGGPRDMRCLIEARIEGRLPVAVRHQAENKVKAVSGAIAKLKAAVEKILGKMNHRPA